MTEGEVDDMGAVYASFDGGRIGRDLSAYVGRRRVRERPFAKPPVLPRQGEDVADTLPGRSPGESRGASRGPGGDALRLPLGPGSPRRYGREACGGASAAPVPPVTSGWGSSG
ncbi:MAG: hypothetical protein BroJett013_07880 [Alphaproteobacteria bacterium]|nr:MAG: hypothetical protein BroJett013_07880 [Alphaproteobacteria bacterium]